MFLPSGRTSNIALHSPPSDGVHEVPFHLLPRIARLLICDVPAGFPSPAADDMEEPIGEERRHGARRREGG